LTQETATKWRGTLRTNGFPPTGIYLYTIRGKTPSGITGNQIWQGRIFNYAVKYTDRNVVVAPNPIRPEHGNQHISFYPNGLSVEIYDISGNLIKVIDNASNWDCTNQRGERVCAGLYFFRASDGNGYQSTGKFSVVK
jgi:hypothetical protein